MAVIDHVMKRLGYVRLSRFGLVLTPEGRVLTLRPAVLDDGTGGKIVGWQDRDLAAMELRTWEPVRPASAPSVAPPVAAAAPVQPPASCAPTATSSPQPDDKDESDDEEWEWMLALARARAATSEVISRAATPVVISRAATPEVISRAHPAHPAPPARRRGETVPPPSAPRAVAKRPSAPVAAAVQPRTVIPIPKLPSVLKPRVTPVIQTRPGPARGTPAPGVPVAPRRIARGTGPVRPASVPPVLPRVPPPLQVPPAASTPLPSIKRLARS